MAWASSALQVGSTPVRLERWPSSPSRRWLPARATTGGLGCCGPLSGGPRRRPLDGWWAGSVARPTPSMCAREELMPELALMQAPTREPALTQVSTREPVLTPDSMREPVLTPDSTREPALMPDSTREPVLTPDSTREPALMPDSTRVPALTPASMREPVLTQATKRESALTPASTLEPMSTQASTAGVLSMAASSGSRCASAAAVRQTPPRPESGGHRAAGARPAPQAITHGPGEHSCSEGPRGPRRSLEVRLRHRE